MTEIVRIYDADGVGYDLCEVEIGTSRVVRVISSHRAPCPDENREYRAQYDYACGYRD